VAETLPDELHDRLALALVPGLGPRLTKALLERFGSAAAVRGASADDLRSVPLIGAKLSAAFAAALQSVDVQRERELLHRYDVRLVPIEDEEYPARLKSIADPPGLLFVRGELVRADDRAVAIVGSRQYTAYGRRAAEQLAGGLARAGFTVVSGLARGIDGFAHRAALKASGRTVALLAGGLARIYPPEHAELADTIADAGALATETPMQVPPQPGMFPARNRLISGMSIAVVVVEAHERSGALITARHAAEQGRDVFVVPGTIDSSASAGCLKLLREGAKLVRGVDDVLEDIDGLAARQTKTAPPKATAPPAEMDQPSRAVWEFLGAGPQFIDDIARGLVVPIPELTSLLMRMELKRLVRRLPGSQYERR
jgi:DNA processing protein